MSVPGSRFGRVGLLVTLLLAAAASAQERTVEVRPAIPGNPYADSWALVVGINNYRYADRLNYAVNDARAVAQALPGLGFQQVRLLLDGEATRAAIEKVIYEEFKERMGPQDRLFVFFAGHGITVKLPKGGEEGYLVPVDGDPRRPERTAIPMDEVRKMGKRVSAKHIFFAIDSCFSGFALTRTITPEAVKDVDLASALQEPVVQVLTAGRKGQRAVEEEGHGLFTKRLLDGLRGLADRDRRGFITVTQLAAWVSPRVTQDSGGRQHPQYSPLDGEGDFVFILPGAQVAKVVPPSEPPKPTIREEVRQELGSLAVSARLPGVEVWLGDQKIGETKAGRTLVVENLPVGTYRVKARKEGHKEWEREVEVAANAKAEVVIDIEALGPAKVIKGDDGAEMVLVPAGEFWMGSDEYADEKPRHRVYLDAYYIDRYEVTNALYKRFVEVTGRATPAYWNDGRFNGSTQPVVGVSWHEAETYCRWAGKRLPTEAEWEKAAQGTDGRRYPWGDQWDATRANSEGSRLGKTGPVGSYPSGVSPYGVHDMAGNVWEWVADWYEKDYYQRSPERNPTGAVSGQWKVLRGGSWDYYPLDLGTAFRLDHTPGYRNGHLGFRCARGVP